MDQVLAFVYWMGTRLVLWRVKRLLKNPIASWIRTADLSSVCLSFSTQSAQTLELRPDFKKCYVFFRCRQEVKLTRSKRN